MKSIVCLKRVPDTAANIRINDQEEVQTDGLEFVTSPYDEYALEEAVQIKEKEGEGEVVVLSLGGDEVEKTIQEGLARGGDRGLHLQSDADNWDPFATAKAIAGVISERESDADVLWFGKHAVDDDGYQIGQSVAALLEWPVATFVSDVLEVGKETMNVEREVDAGMEQLTLQTPCVITAEKGLNEPRYAKLQDIMQAKKKEIETIEVNDPDPTTRILGMEEPPERPAGEILGEGPDAVPELVQKLKEEINVI